MSAPNIRNLLECEIEILTHCRASKRGSFLSLGDFVLKYGQNWSPKTARRCSRGKPRECFRNAALMALDDPKLVYCEGYALARALWPMAHAWCSTLAGELVEPTWRPKGTEYFGIPFRTAYVRDRLLKYERYGLIDQMEFGFPILREKPVLWHHPKFKTRKATR